VNEDLESWAVVGAGDESFSFFYLATPDGNVCILSPDWKDDTQTSAWGFFVSEMPEAGSCPYVEEEGWTYAVLTTDDATGLPLSIVGPYGNEWEFKEEYEFAEEYPTYMMEYYGTVSMEEGYYEEMAPVWYNFIVNEDLNTWAVIATYDMEFQKFYLWTPDDNSCVLTPDWKSENPEDNIWGFFISPEEGYSCPYIEE
jgi:hypothetical protein